MIYTDKTKEAIKILYDKHKDQLDKSGMPYVFHPWHVAEQMEDENTTIVALLHDTIEDTDMTLEDLKKRGFSEEVLEALKLMTHLDGVDYFDYVSQIAENPIATKVKMADLRHNMDLSRIDHPTEQDYLRVEKYKKCYDFLKQKDEVRTVENVNKCKK